MCSREAFLVFRGGALAQYFPRKSRKFFFRLGCGEAKFLPGFVRVCGERGAEGRMPSDPEDWFFEWLRGSLVSCRVGEMRLVMARKGVVVVCSRQEKKDRDCM